MRNLAEFLRDAWQLAKPYFTQSNERLFACGMLATVIALRLVLVGAEVVLSFWNNAFFTSLQEKDWDSFISLLLTWKVTADGWILPGFCGVAVGYIIIAVYRIYLTQWLQIRWRRWMTTRFLDDWLSDRAYYRISLIPPHDERRGIGTENPDQRIAEDLRAFIGDGVEGVRGILFLGIDLLSTIVSLFSFIAILWSLSGPMTILGVSIPGYMVWVALVYAIIGTVLTHLVGRPLAMLNFRKQRVEADFRFALVRMRENTEGIALYGGEAEEQRGLLARFEALAANWWQLMRRYKYLTALTAGYGQIASIFPIVVAAPRFFAGEITLGALTQTAGAFGQVQGALSWFVDSYTTIAAWRATVERLATFQRAITTARAAADEGVHLQSGSGEGYELRGATLALPSGEALLQDADVALRPGEPVIVTGRSGSGKSTLFRALAGIWPFGRGEVRRPAGRTLFLPQRPYIPLGTLRHVVTYPAPVTAHSDAELHDALAAVGLDRLAAQLDDEENWAQHLSGGEQQRLALARALLARPDWLFLDEATASLDPEAEAALYALLRQRLPETTIVSIAHRPAVAGFHERHLVFERGPEGPGRLVDRAAQLA
ncbi:ABC transporter ATP-binding protein/permease [Rhodovastum atsumiense]|uniref:ABC transporter ATP-binding protein/permease n=1 Tax=Rhodovastum atsumiense TaxID=504468 RepID=A0A5M6INE8_9PROT|nr:ABC transporter ATP-binding protein/permease [Rhodovastum atsumiense]KAA5608995.1 ABC transporter ATP-binding protein/permease [Rhodovastum atsumiense]CAH2599090.1 ABC transporter ATP-binding protein/permease [Rhodovastum atsumiense]